MTSSGRFDLLERTLRSLYRYTSEAFAAAIIVEDGLLARVGQVIAIDKAYAQVKTPYIFHCEDDWEFYRPGFIEASRDILERYKNILQVWLRAHRDTNQHPIARLEQFPFPTLATDYHWRGFSWNPGLRRLSDYQWLGSYASRRQSTNAATERWIGQLYCEQGFHAAILPEPGGYVRHLGHGRSVAAGV